MRRIALFLMLVSAGFGQAVRVDPTPVATTSGIAPPGAYAPLLAVPGATVSVCQDAGCATSATTYTGVSGATPCPTNAPLVPRGTATCASSSDQQGNFGFWVLPGTYYYTISFGGNTYGPFPVSASAGGGGGGGSPGLPSLSLQYNCSGSFCGASGTTWNNATSQLTITTAIDVPAISVVGGYLQTAGGLATAGCTSYNCVQIGAAGSPTGGLLALSGSFQNYVLVGSYSGALANGPPATTGDPLSFPGISYSTAGGCFAGGTGIGTWACLTGASSGANTALSNLASVNINTALLFQTGIDIGSASKPPRNIYLAGSGTYGTDYVEITSAPSATNQWTIPNIASANFAGTTGTLTNGHCVSINSSGLLVDAGGACTTGGGGGTVSSSTATYMAYYASTGTTVSGEGDMTYTSGTHTVAIGSSGIFDAHSASAMYLPGSLSTGPVKVTTSTGALSTSLYTDIAALWTGTGCSTGTNALLVNGNCGSSASGVTSINSNTGAVTLAQTTNEVIITQSGSAGNYTYTFSTPQPIGTSSVPTFGGANFGSNSVGAAVNFWGAASNSTVFQVCQTTTSCAGPPLSVDGFGDLSMDGQLLIQYGGAGQMTFGSSEWTPGTNYGIQVGDSSHHLASVYAATFVGVAQGTNLAANLENNSTVNSTLATLNLASGGLGIVDLSSGGSSFYKLMVGAGGCSGCGSGGFSAQSVVTGSRTYNTVYHNTNSGAMSVLVSGSDSGGTCTLTAYTDSSSSPTTAVGSATAETAFAGATLPFIVLAGNYYEVSVSGGACSSGFTWTEWH